MNDNMPSYHPIGFNDEETLQCLSFLYIHQLLIFGGTNPIYYGLLTPTGEEYLENLKQKRELTTFRGILKKYWYGSVILILTIVTLIYVILDFYLK